MKLGATQAVMIAACTMCALAAVSAEAAPARRFALLVAHNDGGPGTAPLRYSESDMRKLAGILRELGGYRDEDIVLLAGKTADDTLFALDAFETRIARAKAEQQAHTTLLVYYSGHGKDGDLRLGKTRLPMATLRRRLHESSADIKLGIIDSCESGAITREKGGRRGPSFLVDTDDREIGSGLILISSSSENESSQESDELGGSFFTHYLTSGLRGDADESGDRHVTLGEVYAYTYHKTVSVTASTRSGTQHPTYSYDLKGNGDIILTDLSSGRSGVSFAEPLAGNYLIFDMSHEQVAAEIRKEAGIARRIALPPGEYVVKKRLDDHLRMKRFSLPADRYFEVKESEMERVEFDDDYAKGAVVERRKVGVRTVFAYQSFFSERARRELFPSVILLGAGVDYGPILGGARISFEMMGGGRSGMTLELQGLAITYDFFELEFGSSLVWSYPLGDWSIFAGPRIAGLYMRRSFPADQMLAKHSQDHLGFSPAILAGVSYRPSGEFHVEAGGRLGYFPFSVDENRSLFYGELSLMLAYRF